MRCGTFGYFYMFCYQLIDHYCTIVCCGYVDAEFIHVMSLISLLFRSWLALSTPTKFFVCTGQILATSRWWAIPPCLIDSRLYDVDTR